MKVIIALLEKRIDIRNTYKDGIDKPFILLRVVLPIIFVAIFIYLLNLLNLNQTSFLDLIKQLNSLIGIILGFSIASFAVFVSINNEKLEETSQQTKYSYREIGSSLFFYNVEVALFTSIIGIFLLYINVPINYTNYVNFSFAEILKLVLFYLYVLMFFQLIFNLFYSSIFLNSSIKKK